MEDILEELVGEIYDEKDETNSEIIQTSDPNTLVVKGSLNIIDLFDEFNITDPDISEEYSTVSGFVIHTLSRYANVGDNFIYQNLYFEVLQVKNYIAELILVYKISDNMEDEEIATPTLLKKIDAIKKRTIKKHNNVVEVIKKKNND